MTENLDARVIYKLLEENENLGWGHVNRRNVDELITIAMEKQNNQLEFKLRAWR